MWNRMQPGSMKHNLLHCAWKTQTNTLHIPPLALPLRNPAIDGPTTTPKEPNIPLTLPTRIPLLLLLLEPVPAAAPDPAPAPSLPSHPALSTAHEALFRPAQSARTGAAGSFRILWRILLQVPWETWERVERSCMGL